MPEGQDFPCENGPCCLILFHKEIGKQKTTTSKGESPYDKAQSVLGIFVSITNEVGRFF
jgi:hypothetical protein